MKMTKLEQIYEGKAKKVFRTDDPAYCVVEYKDDATAFNGLKKGTILGKGAVNNRMTNLLTPLSVGTATICLHGVLILLQLLILRRRYDPVQLLQLPVALVFGYLTDLGVWVIQGIPVPSYGVRWLLCLAGVFLVGVGVALEVVAGVVTLAGEGFVLAVCRVTPFPFGNLKVAFDVLLVGVASLLSLLCLHGLYGVREGTLAAALGVGLIAKRLQPPLQAWFTKRLP